MKNTMGMPHLKTAIISLKSINGLVFVMESDSGYSQIWTESLDVMYM